MHVTVCCFHCLSNTVCTNMYIYTDIRLSRDHTAFPWYEQGIIQRSLDTNKGSYSVQYRLLLLCRSLYINIFSRLNVLGWTYGMASRICITIFSHFWKVRAFLMWRTTPIFGRYIMYISHGFSGTWNDFEASGIGTVWEVAGTKLQNSCLYPRHWNWAIRV